MGGRISSSIQSYSSGLAPQAIVCHKQLKTKGKNIAIGCDRDARHTVIALHGLTSG
jgi:hypothetical protein